MFELQPDLFTLKTNNPLAADIYPYFQGRNSAYNILSHIFYGTMHSDIDLFLIN